MHQLKLQDDTDATPIGNFLASGNPIGGGSQGTVFKAVHKSTKEAVVVKRFEDASTGSREVSRRAARQRHVPASRLAPSTRVASPRRSRATRVCTC